MRGYLFIVLTLIVASIPIGEKARAQPATPQVEFQEVLSDLRELQFKGKAWWYLGQKISDHAAYILKDNARSYATIELYGENLASPTTVQFLDASWAIVQDVVVLPAGSGLEMSRSIPLTSAVINVRVSNPDTVGSGRILIARALVPRREPDQPQGIGPGLPLVSSFANDPTPEKRTLPAVGRSIVFIQIAEPRATVGCTGFVIGNDLIATAAHCIRDARAAETSSNWRDTLCSRIGIVFDFASSIRNDSAPLVSLHCTAVPYLDEHETLVPTGQGAASGYDLTDVALLRVDLSTANPRRAPLPLGTWPQPGHVSVVQNPQGQPQRVARDCEMSADSHSPLVIHHCNTAPGSSGGPIIYYNNVDWYVVGMHTCCANDPAVPISYNTSRDLIKALGIVNAGIGVDGLQKAIQARPP